MTCSSLVCRLHTSWTPDLSAQRPTCRISDLSPKCLDPAHHWLLVQRRSPGGGVAEAVLGCAGVGVMSTLGEDRACLKFTLQECIAVSAQAPGPRPELHPRHPPGVSSRHRSGKQSHSAESPATCPSHTARAPARGRARGFPRGSLLQQVCVATLPGWSPTKPVKTCGPVHL